MSENAPRQPRTVRIVDVVPWVGLAACASCVVLLRPVSPSTPGEAALLLALHTGATGGWATPGWWMLGRCLALLRVDPFVGFQLVGVLAWALGVASLFGIWVRRTTSSLPAWLAAAMLAAWPPLVFRAAMATPDAAGMGLAVAAIASLAAARRRVWAGLAIAAVSVAVLPGAFWVVVPAICLAAWQAWHAGRHQELALATGVGAGASAVLWGVWWLLGPTGAAPASSGGAWSVVAGSPWLGLGMVVLAARGGLSAWRAGHRELVGLAVVGVAVTGAWVAFGAGSGTAVLVAPWLALLVGAVGLPGVRGRWWGVALVGCWSVAALTWTWPALTVRRQPAPAWAAFDWARQNLQPTRVAVVFDPALEPFARLLLAPAGFETASIGSQGASEAIAAGHEVVVAGWVAETGSEVLKAWRWPSGRVQRLVAPGDSGCVLTRRVSADRSTFSREWSRRGEAWELAGEGTVSLDADADARWLLVTPAAGEVNVRTAGFPTHELVPGAKVAVGLPVLPGPAGAVSFRASTGVARFSDLRLETLGPGPLRPGRLVIPQAAAVSGIGGSYWQTDLTLVNPEPKALTVELLFLPSEQPNPRVRSLRVVLAGGKSRLIENVLARREFLDSPRTGALLARAVDCEGTACGFLTLSRTYNVQGDRCDAIGEGLPGLGPAAGVGPRQRAVFESVANNNDFRGYLGFASWSGTRVEVHAVLRAPGGGVIGEMREGLDAWSHRHLRLPRSCVGARLEVEVLGQTDALVFPYLSTVQSARNCSENRYPDRVEGETPRNAAAPRDPELLPAGVPNG
jgi:hypothetical protein